MILIGMFDSPFVRRVAVSLNLLQIGFEHRNWSVGKDFELIRQFNPLGRVPVLVCPDGEALIDSSAILEYVDEIAGPDRALLPRAGAERRAALRIAATAHGAAEKGVLLVYETVLRPENKRHPPWIDRLRTQASAALLELNRAAQARVGEWLVGDHLTQADVTATCVFTYLKDSRMLELTPSSYPELGEFCARCEEMPAFREARAPFSPPVVG
jgi:glutathione S-transferase